MPHLAIFLSACLLAETLTELAVKSAIFLPVRNYLSTKGKFFQVILGCGYCFSVWAAAASAIFIHPPINITSNFFINYFIWILLIHRGSNVLHNCIDKYTLKHYDTRYLVSDK